MTISNNSHREPVSKIFTPPSMLVYKLLAKRGITESDEIENFLNPSYADHVHSPLLLHDMEKALSRIMYAIEHNESIVIYADYDADGIPGAVIFSDFFKKIGYENFVIYIPHRHDEGYGLHQDAVVKFIAGGVKLLVTVDLGITAINEVVHA